jgi:hypothetical protein
LKLETLKLHQSGNGKGKGVKREMEARIDDNCIVQNLIGNTSKEDFTHKELLKGETKSKLKGVLYKIGILI